MSTEMNKKEMYDLYRQVSLRTDEEYLFAVMYERYFGQKKDYGNGILINMVEVHTLTMIADQPGITVNELAKQWKRTKGAVSQNVTKLDRKWLIRRERSDKDSRNVHLYVTEKGQELSDLHKRYDVVEDLKFQKELIEFCSEEELTTFYKVLGIFNRKFIEDMGY